MIYLSAKAVLSSVTPKFVLNDAAMETLVLSETSKCSHISARLVKCRQFCMFGCKADGENSE